MSKVIYNNLPAWKKRLIDNPSEYIQSMFEPDEWFDIVVNELEDYVPWNKGKTGVQESHPLSEKHKKQISKTLTGKKHTDQRKANISKGLTGKTIPQEVRDKIANTLRENARLRSLRN